MSFETFSYQAEVTTASANSPVTDSAAAGTAMATGVKVNNYVVSLAANGDVSELQTTLELQQSLGKKTGLITTTYLTHATPATFGAHATNRNLTADIAADYLQRSRPNILFGGGGNGLSSPSATTAGYQVAVDSAGFWGLSFTAGTHISAQFGNTYLPYEADYLNVSYPYPHLSDMVRKALAELSNDPNGFLLMVKGGMVDQAAHIRNLQRVVHETLELSRAVQEAITWASGRTDTLILVGANHETGNLKVTRFVPGLEKGQETQAR